MRINHLHITNFRSHQDTTLELGRVNFILGHNARGKTSILQAIAMALTGKCDVTDEGGRGAVDLVREGTDSFTVELALQRSKEHTVSRQMGHGTHVLQIDGKVAPVKAFQNSIYIGLDTSEDVLSAVLNASRFVDAPAAARKKLLSQVVAAGEIPVPAEILPLLRGITLRSIADVDKAYQLYYSERTEVSRWLKEHPELEEPSVPGEEMVDEETLAQMAKQYESDLTSAKARRLQMEDGTSQDTVNIWVGRKTNAEEHLLSPEQEKEYEAVLADKESHEALRESISRKEGELLLLRKEADKLNNLKPDACPTCKQKVSPKHIKAAVKKIQEKANDVRADLEEFRSELASRPDPEKARELLAGHRYAKKQLKEANEMLDSLKPAPKEDLDRLDEQIEKLESSLGHIREQQVQIKSYMDAQRAYLQRQEERSHKERRKEELETLCEFLGPNGIRDKVVEERGGAFMNRLNEVMERFGFAATLEEGDLEVDAGLGEPLALHQLSESERFRFGVAFQIALAEVTGLGFVVIDRAEILDPESRFVLGHMLYNSDLEQAIVLGTAQEMPTPREEEGVKWFWLILSNETGATEVEEVLTAEAERELFAVEKAPER